jgi:hypothetical protein
MTLPACDREKVICPLAHAATVEIPRLQEAIGDALTALDEGRYGDVRRIFRTGKAGPVLAVTGVLTKGLG